MSRDLSRALNFPEKLQADNSVATPPLLPTNVSTLDDAIDQGSATWLATGDGDGNLATGISALRFTKLSRVTARKQGYEGCKVQLGDGCDVW